MSTRPSALASAAGPMRRRILLVEDEPELARLVQRQLEQAGYEVRRVSSGEAALQAVRGEAYDLFLLDVMLPGIDGLEVCRRLRSLASYSPVLMITARSAEIDKVRGLETGADDYVTKPFGMQELLARVRAIFRRMDSLSAGAAASGTLLVLGDQVRLDTASREAWVRGTPVSLTRKEFDLLLHFAQNPGRVYSRAQLLDAVWGYTQEGDEHAVNCHINRLRAKIELVPNDPKLLLTVWGVGYKFAGAQKSPP